MKGLDGRELTKSVHLRLKEDMHAQLIALARKDERDLGWIIRMLVREALEMRAGAVK